MKTVIYPIMLTSFINLFTSSCKHMHSQDVQTQMLKLEWATGI